MNATKRINVNFSSLVGLKAELLRKQTEVNEAKLKAETVQPTLKFKKKTKRPKTESDKKTVEDTEVDVNAHKKSKLMLEAKARLYDRLKKSKNNNENFLVDFTNKSDESEEDLPEEDNDDTLMDPALDNEDDWVEYVDCFGRTRKCLREDLPMMQRKDRLVEEQIMKRKNENLKEEERDEPPVIEKEPEIEIMRRKWEEQTQKLADKANIHYQDILFDEARAHGVGYYAFSQDEEERIKQQENLAKLRTDTEKKQKEMKELKQLKERMEQNRLKAARIRQRIRAGLPAEPTEEELAQERESQDFKSSKNPEEVEEDTKPSVAQEEEKSDEKKDSVNDSEETNKLSLVSKEDKIRALGELLGKKSTWRTMSQEEWVEKYRNIRVDEFGPVYSNFRRGGYLVSESTDRQLSNDEENDEISPAIDAYNERLSHPSNETPQPQNTLATDECTIENVNQITPQNSTDNIANVKEPSIKTCINEESIMAGLKYLREKFEERQNT